MRTFLLLSARLTFALVVTFDFGLFALIDIIIATCNSGALAVAEPWEFVGAIATCLHIACVGDVSGFECQRTLVAIVTWSLRLRCLLSTIPSVKCVELFVALRICYPLESLCRCHKPNVRSKMQKCYKMNENLCEHAHAYNEVAQLRNLCSPCSSSLILNQLVWNAIMYGALFCS